MTTLKISLLRLYLNKKVYNTKNKLLSQAANSVDDVEKVGKQFLNHCATKFGIPIQLLTEILLKLNKIQSDLLE